LSEIWGVMFKIMSSIQLFIKKITQLICLVYATE